MPQTRKKNNFHGQPAGPKLNLGCFEAMAYSICDHNSPWQSDMAFCASLEFSRMSSCVMCTYILDTCAHIQSAQILLIELDYRWRALTDVSIFHTTQGQLFKVILHSFVTISFKGPPVFKGYNEMLFLLVITGWKNNLSSLASLTRAFSVVKLPNLYLRPRFACV